MGSSERQGELWGRSAEDWLSLQEGFSIPLWESMLDSVRVETGSKLLDAGCGTGGAAVLADRLGAVITGLDASSGLLDVARRRLPDADLRVGDLERLPFGDASFDAVIAASSIQYADDPGRALSELARVATPGGRVAVGLFSTPDKVEYRVVFDAIRRSLPDPPPGPGPFALSGPGVLEAMLHSAGLTVTDAGEVECPFTFPDMDAFWRGCAAAGPVQAALDHVDAQDLRRRLEEAAAPYRRSDGTVHFEVGFRYVGADRP